MAAGVLITPAAVSDLIDAIDTLAQLADQRGQRLNHRIIALRDQLASHSRQREERPDPIDELLHLQRESVVDTTTAAKQLGLTADGVRHLCRIKKIDAEFRAGRWWISTTELDAHYQARREAGRI